MFVNVMNIFLCWKMTDNIIRLNVQFWVPKLVKTYFLGCYFHRSMIWNGQNSVLIELQKLLNSYFLSQKKHRFVLFMVSDVALEAAKKNRIENWIR